MQAAAAVEEVVCWRSSQAVRLYPTTLFLLLSWIFGALTIALTLPLRGPDEQTHFLRAYAVAMGELVPSTVDEQGRKGVFLPAELYLDIELYERALSALYWDEEVISADVLKDYVRIRSEIGTASSPKAIDSGAEPHIFMPYGGSEGYSPVPYLPYLPGLALARILNLNFLLTVYFMRVSGFMLLTALVAFAVAIVPRLGWGFVAIGLLPSALFSRAVLGADGGALTLVMLITALCLRSVHGLPEGGPWVRSLSITLCVLMKPPQLAFIMLEFAHRPIKQIAVHWRSFAIAVVPAVLLSVGWAAASSADVAAWRLVEGSTEQFEPLWKLQFMLEHPTHFPLLLVGTYHYLDDYWQQLIGILGWLDIPLRSWVYPALSVLLIATFCVGLNLDPRTRRRLATVATLCVLGYAFAIFLIFYLVWTFLDAEQIQGVQGRYFVVVLPLIAILFAALLPRGLPERANAWVTTVTVVLSGWATVDAVLRADWNISLPA